MSETAVAVEIRLEKRVVAAEPDNGGRMVSAAQPETADLACQSKSASG